MNKNILSNNQLEVWEDLKKFPEFMLGGGTGLSLQIGHRKSIDFDLFTNNEFENQKLLASLDTEKINNIIVDEFEQLTLIYSNVKLTFIRFPFSLSSFKEEGINIIDKQTIAAMKAYALGRRAKWKDYVDLYFMVKEGGLEKIIRLSQEIFGKVFSEKLFREQLGYFDDIDYSEEVEYIPGYEVEEQEIKQVLRKFSVALS